MSTVYDKAVAWCKKTAEEKRILFDVKESNKNYIRFKTPCMESLLPPRPATNGDWVKYRYYMYEIEVRDNTLSIGLTVTSLPYIDGAPHPLCDHLRETYGRCQKEEWKTAKLFRQSFRAGIFAQEDEIERFLNDRLQELLLKERDYDLMV